MCYRSVLTTPFVVGVRLEHSLRYLRLVGRKLYDYSLCVRVILVGNLHEVDYKFSWDHYLYCTFVIVLQCCIAAPVRVAQSAVALHYRGEQTVLNGGIESIWLQNIFPICWFFLCPTHIVIINQQNYRFSYSNFKMILTPSTVKKKMYIVNVIINRMYSNRNMCTRLLLIFNFCFIAA